MLYYHSTDGAVASETNPSSVDLVAAPSVRFKHLKGEVTEMREPRVYIVNASGHNHHRAKPYGELVPITRGYVSFGSLDRIFHEVLTGIADSESHDWLLLSGLMFLNALAAALWLERHASLRLLVWDKKTDNYRKFVTDTRHIAEQWKQIHEWSEDGTSPEARTG